MLRSRPIAFAALICVAVLSGCASREEFRADDERNCQGYGFAPGTDAFARCMMASDMRRRDQVAADQRAMQRRIQLDNARTTAEFNQRLNSTVAPPPVQPRDPFAVPNGLQLQPSE
jgi:hypothetical protein